MIGSRGMEIVIGSLCALLILAVVSVVGCSTKPGYSVGRKVTFAQKSFNGMMQSHTVDGADRDSFEIVNEYYGKDKDKVYYKGRAIQGCDPKGLKMMGDANLYCQDGERVFVETKLVSQDAQNFQHQGAGYSTDSSHVFFLGQSIEGADPKTWKSLGDKGAYGHDDQRAFHDGKPLAGEVQLDSFEPLNYYYSRDSRTVWYRDQVIEGADAPSFETDPENTQAAKDKNQGYNQGHKR